MSTDCTDYSDNSCNISPILSREISRDSENENFPQNQMTSPNHMTSPTHMASPNQMASPNHERKEFNLFSRESSSYQKSNYDMQNNYDRSVF